MPGPLPAVTAAALVLAAAPAPAAPPLEPALASAPGGGALAVWSAGDVFARAVGTDGRPIGHAVALTSEGAARRTARAPALLARGDGTFLMAYTARSGLGAAARRTVKLRRVGLTGVRGPVRAAGPAARAPDGGEAAPALAWGPGRRWAVVAWVQARGARGGAATVLARRLRPDGRWLGGRIVLDRVTLGRVPGEFVPLWSRAAPTVASDGRGVLAVWSGSARAEGVRLRAARIDPGGHVKRIALGLENALEQRALGRRDPPRILRETAPRLLARPGSERPILAWGATIPELRETQYRSALLVATIPNPRAIRAVHGPGMLVSTDAERPTGLVAEPGGTFAIAWTLDEIIVAGRGCTGAQPPLARRLGRSLRRIGPSRDLSTYMDPRGPDTEGGGSGVQCRPPIGDAALVEVGGGLLAAYPWAPYVDVRLLGRRGA